MKIIGFFLLFGVFVTLNFLGRLILIAVFCGDNSQNSNAKITKLLGRYLTFFLINAITPLLQLHLGYKTLVAEGGESIIVFYTLFICQVILGIINSLRADNPPALLGIEWNAEKPWLNLLFHFNVSILVAVYILYRTILP